METVYTWVANLYDSLETQSRPQCAVHDFHGVGPSKYLVAPHLYRISTFPQASTITAVLSYFV